MEFAKSLPVSKLCVITAKGNFQFNSSSLLDAILDGNLDLVAVPDEKCILTGEEAMGFQTRESKLVLRPDIFQRLILLSLSPKEFNTLVSFVPDEHYLDTDFYQRGIALQPKAEYLEPSFWYIPETVRKEKQGLNATEVNNELDIF